MYYTYVLISTDGKKTYTGITSDIDRRLKEHNSGKEAFTRLYTPFRILHLENYKNRKDACKREVYFKSTSGRRHIRRLLEDNNVSRD